RPATWAHYESLLRVHVLPTLGRLRLARLQPSHLQRLYADRLATGLSPTTVRHVHKVAHIMLERAVRWGAVVRNVARLVDPPSPARRDLPMITAAQASGLLVAAREHRLEALFVVALTTGARMSELLGLTWAAVDLDRGSVTIRATLHWVGAQARLMEPKTARSRRTIALAPMAVAALRRHRTKQMEESLRVGPGWNNALDLCFTSEIGEPLRRERVLRREFRPLARDAGLSPSLTFHDLRHIAASLALSHGVPWTLVSEMLGHANVSTTMNVYAHTVPGTQGQVADAMEAVFNRAASG
ncbi:MAG: tyrosine-type recombinase/integrase, partial [Chloroflexi bacterium]|nr:tyrosine-type recombinase/integrase [Chloroflexota bacterium]